MSSALIKKQANTFFTIVPRKALRAAGVFVMTMRPWHQEKNINRPIALLKWPLIWASNF